MGGRACASVRAAHEGRVVNFGTRDTTLAMPPTHQTPHLQHGHTFRVGWESGWACTCTCTHIDAESSIDNILET